MKNSIRCLIGSVLVCFITVTFATNYAVGPDKQYKKLQDVVSLLKPGDTVFVDGNTTYTGGVLFSNAGAEASPIVIKGIRINGKRPVISGGTNTVHFSSDWPYTNGADNYLFEGFEITGGATRGIFHQAGNLYIRDVAVHGCPQHGILGADQGSGSCVMEYVEVYNCGAGDSRHQIYMATDEVNRPGSLFRMQHCYIHDATGGNNVKSRAERNEIYYNWIEGAYYHELELIGPDPGGAPDTWTPRLKREDSDIVGNVLMKRRTAAGNDTNFSVTRIGGDATGESHGRYRFVNNTIICGTGSVFRMFDSLESVEMHNNVFYRTGGSVNIMRTIDASWVGGTAVIAGTNNWVYQGASNIPAPWTGTVTGTNPGFTNLAQNDLRPATGSPLINTGAGSVQSAPGYDFPKPLFPPQFRPPIHSAGSAPIARQIIQTIDIGAFEFETTPILNMPSSETVPGMLRLRPDPRSAAVNITYTLACRTPVAVTIFGIDGRRIRTVYSGEQNSGSHTLMWDGFDYTGCGVSAGIYLCALKTEKTVLCRAFIKSR